MKNNDLQIIIAQLDFMVGDIDGNATQILHASRRARDEFHADIIVFPELTLTGYPPEDLLFRASIRIRVQKALARLCADLPA
ncbi:MAG TPA: NAD+ synthase, partial [Gammaproteobacteria bacterium]|nr:NAD+ synthase [Gammaproteobacteria bacterium]